MPRALEHQRRVEVRNVERGVLPDEDGLHVGKAHLRLGAGGEVGGGVADGHFPDAGAHIAPGEEQIPGQTVKSDVTSRLGSALEREGRILVGEDTFHRVHHVDEAHAKTLSLSCGPNRILLPRRPRNPFPPAPFPAGREGGA